MGKHKTEPVKPEAKVQVLVVQADGEKYLEKKPMECRRMLVLLLTSQGKE